MSRGIGGMQRRLLALLREAPAGLSLIELRGAVIGWRQVVNGRGVLRASLRGRWSPAGRDDRALRRALAGLVERGLVDVRHHLPAGWRRARAIYCATREVR